MTTNEQKILWLGAGAGTIVGLALGLMIALFVAVRPVTAGATTAFVTGLLVASGLVLLAINAGRSRARSR